MMTKMEDYELYSEFQVRKMVLIVRWQYPRERRSAAASANMPVVACGHRGKYVTIELIKFRSVVDNVEAWSYAARYSCSAQSTAALHSSSWMGQPAAPAPTLVCIQETSSTSPPCSTVIVA